MGLIHFIKKYITLKDLPMLEFLIVWIVMAVAFGFVVILSGLLIRHALGSFARVVFFETDKGDAALHHNPV